MDPWHQFWSQFFFHLSDILPWFVAGAGALVVVSLTPLGRALTRYLRDASSRRGELPAESTAELSGLRADIAEVLERLDFLERTLTQRSLPPIQRPSNGPETAAERTEGPPSRVPTPV